MKRDRAFNPRVPVRVSWSLLQAGTKHSERGVALILTLLIATILLGLGLALVLLASIERTTSYQVQRERQAFYTADVETAYLTIARMTIAQFNDWNQLLGNGAGIPTDCNRMTPPQPTPNNPCPEQVPASLSDFQGFECKGRVLPSPGGSGWNLGNEAQNPFRLRCADAARFCNCQVVLPDNTLSPNRITLYVRDDPQDGDTNAFQDSNGDIQLIAVSETGGVLATAAVRTVLAFDLSRRTIIGNPCALPELTGACESGGGGGGAGGPVVGQ
jgi:hypothetical protein